MAICVPASPPQSPIFFPALSTFLTAQTINLHELFLAAAVSIAPLVLVFVFLQRYLVQGWGAGGVKG